MPEARVSRKPQARIGIVGAPTSPRHVAWRMAATLNWSLPTHLTEIEARFPHDRCGSVHTGQGFLLS